MLSALAAYRSQNRPTAFQGNLAWLVKNIPPFKWDDMIYHDYYVAAKDQAKTHGYGLEVFDLQEAGLSSNRLGQILRSRNIQGIFVCPLPEDKMEIVFPWEHFSVITFGFSLVNPRLHTVAAAHFDSTRLIINKLRAKGHTHIGMMSVHDSRLNNDLLAGYFSESFVHDKEIKIPPLHLSETSNEHIQAWYDKYKPSAIIGPPDLDERLAETSLPIEDVLLICAYLPRTDWPLGGVHEDTEQIGRVAADLLVSMIQHGERGVPSSPRRTLIEGKWVPESRRS